jgi:hypothetical protein
LAETPATGRKLNNLEDIHCVRDACAAGLDDTKQCTSTIAKIFAAHKGKLHTLKLPATKTLHMLASLDAVYKSRDRIQLKRSLVVMTVQHRWSQISIILMKYPARPDDKSGAVAHHSIYFGLLFR